MDKEEIKCMCNNPDLYIENDSTRDGGIIFLKCKNCGRLYSMSVL